MRKLVLNSSLALRLSEEQRAAIERIADQKEIALGEACRELIDLGLKARAMG